MFIPNNFVKCVSLCIYAACMGYPCAKRGHQSPYGWSTGDFTDEPSDVVAGNQTEILPKSSS